MEEVGRWRRDTDKMGRVVVDRMVEEVVQVVVVMGFKTTTNCDFISFYYNFFLQFLTPRNCILLFNF